MDISVIIPVFNGERTIGTALRSALAQADVSFEIIVVDDCSADASCAVVEDLADARVRLFRQLRNSGPAAARNRAIAEARGKYLAILDADDRFLPGRLKNLYEAAEASGCDLIADNIWIQPATDPADVSMLVPEKEDGRPIHVGLSDFFDANIIFGDAPALGYLKPMFRAKFLKDRNVRYRENLIIGEDFAFVADLLANGARYIRQHQCGYVYSRHSSSLSFRITGEQISAMMDFDDLFVSEYRRVLSPREFLSIDRHKKALVNALAFTESLEGFRKGHLLGSMAKLARSPASWPLLRYPLASRIDRLAARLAI